jgi:hypothetical protein
MLTLPLLVLRLKFINHVKTALATDDDVVGADFLDTCTYFHTDQAPLESQTHCLNLIIVNAVKCIYRVARPR